jgi:hypothetical protein
MSKYGVRLNVVKMQGSTQSRGFHLQEVLVPMTVVLRQPTVSGGRVCKSLGFNLAISLVNETSAVDAVNKFMLRSAMLM